MAYSFLDFVQHFIGYFRRSLLWLPTICKVIENYTIFVQVDHYLALTFLNEAVCLNGIILQEHFYCNFSFDKALEEALFYLFDM